MKRPPPPWKATEAHAVHPTDRPSAAVDAVYTQQRCDGRFEADKEQTLVPHEPTRHPSHGGGSQHPEPCSAAKVIVAVSSTMHDACNINAHGAAAAAAGEVGEFAATKLT
jgi:hypothetical protein